MEFPFEVYIDGKKIEKLHINTKGKDLVARVLPKAQWPKNLQEELTEIRGEDGPFVFVRKLDKPLPVLAEPVNLYLFETPADKYCDLEKHIGTMKDKRVCMGNIPTLKAFRQTDVNAHMQPGFFYDMFAIGTVRGEKNKLAGGGRLATTKEEVPYNMTLDEMKLFAIEDLGLTLEQAKKVYATITPMTAWGSHGGRFIIAGFTFKKAKKPGFDYGVMVDHMGGVDHYHRYSTQEIREAIMESTS